MARAGQDRGYFATYRQRWWRGLVVGVGVLLSVLAFLAMVRTQQLHQAEQFRHDIDNRAEHLEQTLSLHLGALEAMATLFGGSDDVTATEFANSARQLSHSRPALLSLQWRAATGPTTGTAGVRRFPVTYRQDLVAGLPSSLPEPGGGRLDPGVEWLLLPFPGGSDRILALHPVFWQQNGHPFQGYVSALLSVRGLISAAHMHDGDHAVQFRLQAAGPGGNQVVLYESPALETPASEMSVTAVLNTGAPGSWTLTAIPSQQYRLQLKDPLSVLVLVLGLLLTLTAYISLGLLLRRSESVEREVEERTRELHEALERLNRIATTDELTGLANRRRFDEVLDQECRRAQREFLPLTLIMVDVDCFKAYNDHYGHPAGDRCLHQVACALKEAVTRPGDLVARYGGEELVLLLPSTNAQALELAERCRQCIRALNIPHEHSDVAEIVTVSIGVCTLQPSARLTPDHIIERADQALYRAKHEGRDRVAVDIEDGHEPSVLFS